MRKGYFLIIGLLLVTGCAGTTVVQYIKTLEENQPYAEVTAILHTAYGMDKDTRCYIQKIDFSSGGFEGYLVEGTNAQKAKIRLAPGPVDLKVIYRWQRIAQAPLARHEKIVIHWDWIEEIKMEISAGEKYVLPCYAPGVLLPEAQMQGRGPRDKEFRAIRTKECERLRALETPQQYEKVIK